MSNQEHAATSTDIPAAEGKPSRKRKAAANGEKKERKPGVRKDFAYRVEGLNRDGKGIRILAERKSFRAADKWVGENSSLLSEICDDFRIVKVYTLNGDGTLAEKTV